MLKRIFLAALLLPGVAWGQVDGPGPNAPVVATGGTVARTAAARAGDIINVKDYGAKCDYTTDDTSAINAALAATNATWGGDVYLPQGGCKISGSLTIAHPHVHLRGAGQTETQIITNSTTFNVIELSNSTAQISDLWINQYGAPGATQYWAIHDNTSGGSYDLILQNVEISGGHSGIYSKGGRTVFWRPKITALAVSTGVGIQFAGLASGSDSEVHDVYAPYMENASGSNASAGILITGGADYTISHAQLQKMGSPLIIRPASGHIVTSVMLTGDYFDTSTGPEAIFDGTSGGVQEIMAVNSWFSSSGSGAGIQLLGSVNDLSITNSEIYSNAGCGVDATAATYTGGLTLTANLIAGNTGFGVCLGATTNITIVGNTITRTGNNGPNAGGVSIASGVGDYISIIGNNLAQNTGAAISNSATGFHNTIYANADGRILGSGAASLQQHGVSSSTDAQGSESFIGSGNSNYIYGAQGFIGSGYANIVNGILSAIGSGQLIQLNGKASAAPGGQYGYDNGNDGSMLYSYARFGSQKGSSQIQWNVLSAVLTSTSATRLTTDMATAGSSNVVAIPAGAIYKMNVDVQCRDTTTTDYAAWTTKQGVLQRQGANAVYTGSASSGTAPDLASSGSGSTASLIISADTTLQAPNISVAWPNSHAVHCNANVGTLQIQ